MDSLKKHLKKILFISLLIALGGVLIYLLFTSSSIIVSPQKKEVCIEEKTTEYLKQISPKMQLQGISEQKENKNNTKKANSSTLTDTISKVLFEEIKKRNPNELQNKNGKLAIAIPEISSFLNKVGREISENKINPLYLVDSKKIIISYNTSKKSQIRYIKQLENVVKKDFGDFRKTGEDILRDIENNNFYSAKKLAKIYSQIIDDIYKISVPQNWIDFHKYQLAYFYSAKNIYQSLANYQKEPLLASLAVKDIFNIKKANYLLKLFFVKKINENKLSL